MTEDEFKHLSRGNKQVYTIDNRITPERRSEQRQSIAEEVARNRVRGQEARHHDD